MYRVVFVSAFVLVILSLPAAAQWGDGESPPAPVEVAAVAYEPLVEQLPLTGSVTARNLSALSPQVAAVVDRLLVDTGTAVSDGDELLHLDDSLARQELREAEASLNAAKAARDDAERRLRESEELFRKQHIASSTLEAVRAEASIAAADAEREEAVLERQRELLRRYVIRAPFDGVVANRWVDPGEWVSPGQPVFDLVELERVRVDVQVPQFYFGRIQVGQAVTIRVDAYPDRIFNGQIDVTVPLGEAGTRTFLARVELDNPDRALVPGMSARVQIAVAGTDDVPVLQVARDAILRRSDGQAFIYVLGGGADALVARQVMVNTGRSSGDRIAVESDELQPGDRVVVVGNETLTPNQRVRVVRDDG